jgi:hypothetical protein
VKVNRAASTRCRACRIVGNVVSLDHKDQINGALDSFEVLRLGVNERPRLVNLRAPWRARG